MLLERLKIPWLWLLMWALPIFGIAQDLVITVEHAKTADEIAWGLMQRYSLPANHGMLFHFFPPQRVSFWMFNTYIDLEVAFIDEQYVIQEICLLKAYPERMRFLPPIRDVRALKRIASNHPTIIFFNSHSAKSTIAVAYALEMPAGWFEEHAVRVGDSIALLAPDKIVVNGKG